MGLKILVVEDEPIIAQDLCFILEDHGHEPCGTAASYKQALAQLKSKHLDLVLIDINLKGSKNGTQLAQHIKQAYGLPFLFITSSTHPSTLASVKHLHPIGYVVKPFDPQHIYTAIEIGMANWQQRSAEQGGSADATPNAEGLPVGRQEAPQDARLDADQDHESPASATPQLTAAGADSATQPDHVFIKEHKGMVKVHFNQVLYIEANDKYLFMHTAHKKHIAQLSLKEMLAQLPPYFLRVHKSYIVNVKLIEGLGAQGVLFANQAAVPVGRAYKKALMQRLNFLSA